MSVSLGEEGECWFGLALRCEAMGGSRDLRPTNTVEHLTATANRIGNCGETMRPEPDLCLNYS